MVAPEGTRRNRRSANSSTMPWPASSVTTLPLKGVLPKDYARPALDKKHLGQLIDMISNIKRSATRMPAP